MADEVTGALQAGGIIDMTTTGRKTGQARRLEIVFHNIDGTLYITGRPGRRDWYANLLTDPSLTLHLKRGLTADLPATAQAITDEPAREDLLYRIMTESFNIPADDADRRLPEWVADAPLIEVTLAE